MKSLLISIDKTEDVYNTDKYEHEILPKQKFIDNFFSIDFDSLKKYDIEEVFLFNHRNIVLTDEDFEREFNAKYITEWGKEYIGSIIKTSVNILNRNRFHLINTKQEFINVISYKNIILLEEFLDEFTTFFIHKNFSIIKEIIVLDKNYNIKELSAKQVLKNTWGAILKKSEEELSKPLFINYFQKYLIDFLGEPYDSAIKKIIDDQSSNKTYYFWGRDELLINSLFVKIYNNILSNKEYVNISNSNEFKIPFSKNIFIIIKDKINEDAVIERLAGKAFEDKRIFIFNITGINYKSFELFDSLYIPRISELDVIYHNIFTYFLIIYNSNDNEIIKFLIDLEGYPDFFNKLKSFPQIRDIQNFTSSFSLSSQKLKSVKQVKDFILKEYDLRKNSAVNKIYWQGSEIIIEFHDYKYKLKESTGLHILIYLLGNPGRRNPENFNSIIFNKYENVSTPWDTYRKNYDNFLKELLKYEQNELFQLHTLHNYLVSNKIIDFKTKFERIVISISDPTKWDINV